MMMMLMSTVTWCRENRLDLIPLVSEPSWRFDQENLWRLPGAHGEEVVRSVYLDEKVCITSEYDVYGIDWMDGADDNNYSRTLCLRAERMGLFVRGSLRVRGREVLRRKRLRRDPVRRKRIGRRGGLSRTRSFY